MRALLRAGGIILFITLLSSCGPQPGPPANAYNLRDMSYTYSREYYRALRDEGINMYRRRPVDPYSVRPKNGSPCWRCP